jgi:hypothetical protein
MNSISAFSVWIATFDREITIGIDDTEHTSGTHTIMNFYGNEVDEQLKVS